MFGLKKIDMPNSTQTRTILNDKQFQILSAALHKVAPQYSNAYFMLTILQAFYQTDEAVAQLVTDTGLTSAQVRVSTRILPIFFYANTQSFRIGSM